MTDTKETLGANLKAARAAVGDPSYDGLAREMYVDLRRAPNGQTIRQYHDGKVGLDRVDINVIAWLAIRYGIPVYELSPSIAAAVSAARGVLLRSTWSVTGVENPPVMQGVLSLDFGHFHTPTVVCRCGEVHELKAESAPCAYCATPTFDEHLTCAQCRDVELLEHLADDVIDLVELTARSA